MSLITLIVFTATFIWLAMERSPRHLTALTGAGVLILLGQVSPLQAFHMINWSTMGVLLILFVIVGVLFEGNVFNILGAAVIKLTKGNPTALFFILPLLSGVMSMVLNNIAVMLFLALLTLEICRSSHLDPGVLITSEVCAANAGGSATLIGSPPNLLMGTTLGYGFRTFLRQMAPMAVIACLLIMLMYYLIHRRALRVPELPLREIPSWKKLHKQMLFNIWKRIDWQTLCFFVGLFILVGALDRAGVFRFLSQILVTQPHSPLKVALLFLGMSALVSAVVDNIPMALAMAYVIKDLRHFPDAPPEGMLVWAALIGLTLGGNLTPIGATTNVVAYAVLERADRKLGWRRWFSLTAVPTLAALAGVSVLVWLKYSAGAY